MSLNTKWQLVQAEGGSFRLKRDLTTAMIEHGLRAGDISWADFVYVEGRLMRLFEFAEFRQALPPPPDKAFMRDLDTHLNRATPTSVMSPAEAASPPSTGTSTATGKPAAPVAVAVAEVRPSARANSWYLQFEGSEFGPITLGELQTVMQAGKIKGRMFVWKRGLENWVPVKDLSEFSRLFADGGSLVSTRPVAQLSRPEPPSQEGRVGARYPLIATAWTLGEGATRRVLGICNDISEGGMQLILDEERDAIVGGSMLLEIMPTGATGISSFRVTARVVWSKDAERRIGLQFVDLRPQDRLMLQKHIQASTQVR